MRNWRRLRTGAICAAAIVLSVGMNAARAQVAPALTRADVETIVAQATQEAEARHRTSASIAVVDRVGNLLGLFSLSAGPTGLKVTSNRGLTAIQLEGFAADAPAGVASALAKAITGAYLSSSGNAFSTRTASQIVQENFNPGQKFQPAGPLFGVQFSQLPCSDLSLRASANSMLGPQRSPLGLSADPGGLPLYKQGQVVGGIGIEADGIYTADGDVYDIDTSDDELIALAGTVGFDAPAAIRAPMISAGGLTLRYVDRDVQALQTTPGSAPAYASLLAAGRIKPVALSPAYGVVNSGSTGPFARAGSNYGAAESGYRLIQPGEFPVSGAMILVDGNNANRYPPRAGSEAAGAMTAPEVSAILEEAYKVAISARAQIRRPLGSFAQVTISIVDSQGEILGLIRTADAPVFGTDVSVQKARTAAFFSGDFAKGLNQAGAAAKTYSDRLISFLGGISPGSIAFSARGIGNLARPFYPDGINSISPGPLSQTFEKWSPFADGLQLELVIGNIGAHVGALLKGTPDTPAICTPLGVIPGPGSKRLGNGIQIFPGGFPIYRGNNVVGGIGISGDGVDQDDMISFLGLARASTRLNGSVNHAPAGMRDDRLSPSGARLRYASCPFAPFLGKQDQNPCLGL